jgi:hypothetical protein
MLRKRKGKQLFKNNHELRMPNYNEMETKKGGHADHLSNIKKWNLFLYKP